MKNYLRGKKGFSMVELSVVLTIIGITIAGALDIATRKTESDRITETNTRMAAIEKALLVYVINNQRLPCPADASLTLSVANAGREQTMSGGNCVGFNYTDSDATSTPFYSGTVPTKTLGLPDKMMADDWDRRFTYVVDRRFVNSAATTTCSSTDGAQICFKNTTISSSAANAKEQTSMTVNDSTANSSSNRATDAVYVLISHGKNGYGAFKYTGSATQLTASSDADEISNAAVSNATLDQTFVQADTSTTFDDILNYKNKATIILGVNGITDSTTCTAAVDHVNTPGTLTDPCPGATSTVNCDLMAVLVNRLCLQP